MWWRFKYGEVRRTPLYFHGKKDEEKEVLQAFSGGGIPGTFEDYIFHKLWMSEIGYHNEISA
jgi:hypothetical protein